MLDLKNFQYSLFIIVILSTLFGSQTLSAKANNSPSAGQAGVLSGTSSAYNTTVFASPPQLSTVFGSSVSFIREFFEITTTNETTGESTQNSREINSVQELITFVDDTVGKVLGNGTGVVRIRGLTITISSPTTNTQGVDNNGEIITKTITFAKEGRGEEILEVTGTNAQLVEIISVTGVLYDLNVSIENIRLASQLILAGADAVETGYLIFALNGITVEGQDVDISTLSTAINAYNTIIDKADTDAIASLQNTEAFIDIGELLKELRAAIG